MNSRQAQIESAYHALRECGDPVDRERHLARLAEQDPPLHREVESLLRAADAANDLFPPECAPRGTTSPEESIGSVVGRYRITGKIGEGGMGVVCQAEQLEPVRRRVALKVIKLGMDTRQVVGRFEAERQALALMDHPNIAKVLDCGTTEAGRPYFVMELVEGFAITDYCAKHRLSLDERLRLFIQVCHAVQHAHQKGIIHRDLKPSNVLVTTRDGVAVPKVIDFGVAKATHQRLTEKTVFTQHAMMIGTPAYMSPEQAEASGLDVDTRADIYSLGALLYELLAGSPPFPEERLRTAGYGEMQRILLHEEPERPSTRVRRIASAGRAPVQDNRPFSLDPDLDWIAIKCLEKDCNRRYATANGLAADLQRYLDDEPIAARPPSMLYRTHKAIRRNKVVCVAAVILLLAITVGIVSTARQAARANRRLHDVVELLDKTFSKVVPDLGYTIGATQPRKDLALAGAEIADRLIEDSTPTPQIRRVLGQLYLNLAMVQANLLGTTTGEYSEGLVAARRAIEFLRPREGETPDDERIQLLALAEMRAGMAAHRLLRFEEALKHFETMGRWEAKVLNSTNQEVANRAAEQVQWARWLTGDTLLSLGQVEFVLTNVIQPYREEATRREVRDERGRRVKLEDMRDGWDGTGRCLLRLGKVRSAAECFRRALPMSEELNARFPSHSAYACYLVQSRARLGEALLALGSPDEALPLLEGALDFTKALQQRDGANPGFHQLEVEVLQCFASGYVRWAADPSTASADRVARATKARENLARAERILTGLVSKSLRDFLRFELQQTAGELTRVEAAKDSSRTGSKPE